MSEYKIEQLSTGDGYIFDTIEECIELCKVNTSNYRDFRLTELCRGNETDIDIKDILEQKSNVTYTDFEIEVFNKHTRLTSAVCKLVKEHAPMSEINKAVENVVRYEDFFKEFFNLDVQKFYNGN